MTARVPEADRLLQAAADYLEQELLPTLAGYHGFQTRVCVNVLRIVAREAALGAAAAQDERERLERLLGREAPLDELEAALCADIASGALPLESPALVAHLRHTLRDALAINNPKWLAPGPG